MNPMKKIIPFLLIAALMLGVLISGCGAKETDSTQADLPTTDDHELQDKIEELESRIADLTAAGEAAAAVRYAVGVNALLSLSGDTASPQGEVAFSGSATITAAAVIPEGMALDHWSVNGAPLEDSQVQITVDADGNTVIEAVMRAELKVTAVNAYIQLLSDKGEPEGDKLAEYVFEEEEGQLVSIYIHAEIPSGYEVDYWLIDGVAHHFNKTVTSIKMYNLDASAAYEVVLKKKAATGQSPNPSSVVVPG
jgi:outer membrane murein-binding lipoprotein Lpp